MGCEVGICACWLPRAIERDFSSADEDLRGRNVQSVHPLTVVFFALLIECH